MKILALEPYLGGSHQAFLAGWSARSRHRWTVLGLPAYKWKWRMRHAAVTLAAQVGRRIKQGESWDLVFCSDMLNLAEFRGLSPAVARLPCVAYFHENQLTYPVRHEDGRDMHFAFTNFTTALAADQVWFNSSFHRDQFLGGLRTFLRRMPDHQSLGEVETIRDKSRVFPPGVDPLPPRAERKPGPLRIAWAARWEHDKNPETFFAALEQIQSHSVDFRVSVLGQGFRDVPAIFQQARERLGAHIDHWGYQPSRAQYVAALQAADVIVSTAGHEFFGIAVVEAIMAGAYPLLPRRLSYPEIMDVEAHPARAKFFYDGSVEALADRLVDCSKRVKQRDDWRSGAAAARGAVLRFSWDRLVPQLDAQAMQL